MTSVNTQLLQSPLPTLLKSLGEAIADAQFALDTKSAEVAQRLGDDEQTVSVGGTDYTLLELGFTPSFYHLASATVEARVAFSSTQTTEVGVDVSVGGSYLFFSASVDASYSNKYSFTAEGSSSITAQFVSVPPPPVLQDRLNRLAVAGGAGGSTTPADSGDTG